MENSVLKEAKEGEKVAIDPYGREHQVMGFTDTQVYLADSADEVYPYTRLEFQLNFTLVEQTASDEPAEITPDG